MSSYKQRKAQNLVRFTALASQFMVIAFLAIEILQMAFVNMYNSNLTLLILFSSFAHRCCSYFYCSVTSRVVQIK